MAKKTSSAAALATTEAAAIDPMQHDPLAELGLGDMDLPTGTEELGRGDVRMPYYRQNTKFIPPGEDEPISPRKFLNTVTEDVKDKLRLQVLTVHKSRAYHRGEGEARERICASWDNVTGTMADGTTRPCQGCPDFAWRRGENGKNRRNCAESYNLVSVDLDDGEVVTFRASKTAIAPFKEYFQRNFYKKRRLPGGVRRDMPLFAYETHIFGEMKTAGGFTWALPRFELGPLMDQRNVAAGAQLVRELSGELLERARQSEADVETHAIEDGDTSFDPDSFVDTEKSASGNRFA